MLGFPCFRLKEFIEWMVRFQKIRQEEVKQIVRSWFNRSNSVVVPASISNALSRYCNPDSKIGVCISGGVDSMSLMYASKTLPAEASLRHIASAKELATQSAQSPLVITVDHQLRTQSSQEAVFVCETAERAGLQSVMLKLDWHGETVAANKIMEEARNKRYRAIADACLSNGVDRLMTAHHQGDQLETLLMRLRFGSGLCGLAAMRPVTSMSHLLNSHEPALQKLPVVRPFLNLTRQNLREYCEDNGLEWVEDPTNRDTKYMRTRMRNMLKEDSTGFREQVQRLLGLCQRWRDRVEQEAVQLAHSAAVPAPPIVYWLLKYLEDGAPPVEFPCARVELHIPTLQLATPHAQAALVSAALQAVHSRNHAPHSPVRPLAREDELFTHPHCGRPPADVERALQYAAAGETVKRTFHKCYVSRSGTSMLVIEAQR